MKLSAEHKDLFKLFGNLHFLYPFHDKFLLENRYTKHNFDLIPLLRAGHLWLCARSMCPYTLALKYAGEINFSKGRRIREFLINSTNTQQYAFQKQVKTFLLISPGAYRRCASQYISKQHNVYITC